MRFTKQPQIRILHIVGGMNRGGIETWLMHILRHIDREQFQMDFLVHTAEDCAYDDEIRALGSKVIPCPNTSNPWLYARDFKHIIRDYSSYDVVHSHVHHFSGYVLRLAQEASIPVRIAHSHINSSPLEANAAWHRHLYLNLMRALISYHATTGLGCSQVATADLFGSNWKSDPRWQLLYYGIDMKRFRESVDVMEVRKEFNVPIQAFVIGHVGRFEKQKNHQFLLEIFAEVVLREPQTYLLLIGEGSLRPSIEQQAEQMQLSERVIFAGSRYDVPKLMLAAMDVFLLPSLSEGLPMVGIEAQAAGLPTILSNTITEEVNKLKQLVQIIDLLQPAEVWANAVLAAKDAKYNTAQGDSLAVLEKSEFNIAYSVKALTKTYVDEYRKAYKAK